MWFSHVSNSLLYWWSLSYHTWEVALPGNVVLVGALGALYAVAERLEYSVGSITSPICPYAPPPRLDGIVAAFSYSCCIM
eukprot:1530675-Ditylum_brightwellii.AAC.1